MNAIASLEQQVITLRAVAGELERIAAHADINTTAVSITAESVRLAAKYLEGVILSTHNREIAAKARGAGAAG